MSNIRIVTDSSAHLTRQEIETYGIEVVPLRLRMGRKSYREGVDLDTHEYFQKLESLKTLPTSQEPLLQDFVDTYHKLSRGSDQILSIHISSRLNGACQVARTAAATLRGRTQITVIDSETISRGLGMIVLSAAKAAADGADIQEVSRLVRGIVPSIFLSFFVTDLAYPERDDRIRHSQAILGSMLGIKPMMEIREGGLVVMEKVLTSFDMIEKLFNYISEFAYLKEIALLQHQNTRDATALLEQLETAYPDLPIFTDTYEPTLATYVGPRALGVIVREEF